MHVETGKSGFVVPVGSFKNIFNWSAVECCQRCGYSFHFMGRNSHKASDELRITCRGVAIAIAFTSVDTSSRNVLTIWQRWWQLPQKSHSRRPHLISSMQTAAVEYFWLKLSHKLWRWKHLTRNAH